MRLKARRELQAVTAPRYQSSPKKQRILDEFVAATCYHRQYAIPLLKHFQATRERPSPPPTKLGHYKRG